jgi:hypothetical protein
MHHRRLAFTREGEFLPEDARHILALWDAARLDLQNETQMRGPIRVTANDEFVRRPVASLLNEFLRVHPRVEVVLITANANVDPIDKTYLGYVVVRSTVVCKSNDSLLLLCQPQLANSPTRSLMNLSSIVSR